MRTVDSGVRRRAAFPELLDPSILNSTSTIVDLLNV